MSIINAYMTKPEICRLKQSDHDFFKRRLEENCLLNTILHKPTNSRLLDELLCLLDRKPIPRRKIEHRNGKVTVRKVTTEEMNKLWK